MSQKNGRAYKMGNAYHEIPIVVITQYAKLNTPPLSEDASHDKGLVTTVLLATTHEEELIADNISEDVLEFIRGKRTKLILLQLNPTSFLFIFQNYFKFVATVINNKNEWQL